MGVSGFIFTTIKTFITSEDIYENKPPAKIHRNLNVYAHKTELGLCCEDDD